MYHGGPTTPCWTGRRRLPPPPIQSGPRRRHPNLRPFRRKPVSVVLVFLATQKDAYVGGEVGQFVLFRIFDRVPLHVKKNII